MAKRKPDSLLSTLDREVNARLSGTKYVCINGRILIDPDSPFEINPSPAPITPTQYCESTSRANKSTYTDHTSNCTCMMCYARERDMVDRKKLMDIMKKDPMYRSTVR